MLTSHDAPFVAAYVAGVVVITVVVAVLAAAGLDVAMVDEHTRDVLTLVGLGHIVLLPLVLRGVHAVTDTEPDPVAHEIRELRTSLRSDHFWVAYQPIVCATSGRTVGLEALLRWNHPTRGAVTPAEFIPVAERAGIVGELTDFVLERVLGDLVTSGRTEEVYVSVNVSAHDLTGRDLAASVDRLLRRFDLPPWSLQLELTETAAMTDPDVALAAVSRLRDLGVTLALDDFGTGHASLAWLQSLPVHCLKIDRGFVSDLASSANDREIVHATIDLAHRLGLVTVAEGVEDERTRDDLLAMGCDLLQGFFLGRPTPNGLGPARPVSRPTPRSRGSADGHRPPTVGVAGTG